MAKNDMPVIIYKILKYLYECMKAGKQPDEMDFCAESKLISIPPLYWNCVIREMYDNGFVRGVSVLSTKDEVYGAYKEFEIEAQQWCANNALDFDVCGADYIVRVLTMGN